MLQFEELKLRLEALQPQIDDLARAIGLDQLRREDNVPMPRERGRSYVKCAPDPVVIPDAARARPQPHPRPAERKPRPAEKKPTPPKKTLDDPPKFRYTDHAVSLC